MKQYNFNETIFLTKKTQVMINKNLLSAIEIKKILASSMFRIYKFMQ